MSDPLHTLHAAHRALESIGEAKTPLGGAGMGAAVAGIGTSGALALVGLALTPLGWGAALLAGAVAGGSYVASKLSGEATKSEEEPTKSEEEPKIVYWSAY